METAFYLAGAVAVAATVMAITRLNVVHALLYLVVSLLAVAVVFFVIGAPFIAALEVIIYAGAIMVLFIFVVMLLNQGEQAARMERRRRAQWSWLGPAALSAILFFEMLDLLVRPGARRMAIEAVDPKQVGIVLFGPYVIGVELASMLLLAGLVGAYHIGRKLTIKAAEILHDRDTDERRVVAGGDLVHARSGRRDDTP